MTSYSKERIFLFTLLIFLIFTSGSGQINFSTGSSYRYLKGTEAVGLASAWTQPAYDDSGWSTGSAPFRYGDGSGGTELSDMQGSYSALFLRSEFTLQNLDNIEQVMIGVNWDDGFMLWINGKEALSQQPPSSMNYDAIATGSHESGTLENFAFDASVLELYEGVNSVAVMACNISLEGSSDFYFDMSITAQVQLPELPEFVDTLGIAFSNPSGFYEEGFSLFLSSPHEGASIFYTLDGSNPQNSISRVLYDSITGIVIDPSSSANRTLTPAVVVRASAGTEGFKPGKPSARTYIYLQNVKSQDHPGGNWPAYNMSNGNSQYFYYEMDPGVVNSSEYSSQMDAAFLDIPSISLITSNENLFDPGYGIYVNADQHGYEWERECSVELIQPDGSAGFNLNAGLRIRGGWSRHNNYPKHAFRLFFREEYGSAELNYPLFEDEGVTEFDKVDLRCAQNYSWANEASKYNTFVREVFARDAQKDSGQPYTRSRYYHLYLNGLYWGLYQTQERAEDSFAEEYFGGQREDYDVIKPNGVDYQRNVIATAGTIDKWAEIFDLTQQGYESNEAYFRMESKDARGKAVPGGEIYVEVDNLIDYMMNIIFTGNYDSPTGGWSNNKSANNFFAIGNREKRSEGFRFFIHDAEHSLMNEASAGPGIGLYENRADIGDRAGSYRMVVTVLDNFHPQWLHYKLSKNEEYRVRFANRAWHQLTGDGIFTPGQNTIRFDKRAEQIDMAIIAESARWGGARTSTAKTKADWLNELDVVRNEYFPYRTEIVINQLKELDLFPSVAAPEIKDQEGEFLLPEVAIAAAATITFSNPSGSGNIYYTLDGSDPRQIGGDINTQAIKISSGQSLDLSSSGILRSRIISNNKWSALTEVKFIADQADYSHFKVTELHYHPRMEVTGTDTTFDEAFEFIEFKNTSLTEGMNLSGLVLDSAVYYEFPDRTILAPQQYWVLASRPTSFFERYGMHPSGNYQRNFSNAGERILVRKSTGEIVLDFTYDDSIPWPEYADGIGASLVSVEVNPEGDPNDPVYWTSSTLLHGTPFANDLPSVIEEETMHGEQKSIWLYPNPTADLLRIRISDNLGMSNTVRIYDLRGTLYYQEDFTEYAEVSLGSLNLSAGIYLVEIVTERSGETRKLIYTPR